MARRRKNLGQGDDLNGILFPPHSDWAATATFPDLSDATIISIDSETRDPNLKDKGPGFIRGDAYPVGFSVATDTGFSGYYPIRHLSGGNLDPQNVLRWLKDILGRERQEKVGASLIYDLEALKSVGIEVRGRLHDVQLAESLIDEESYSGFDLDSIAKKYGVRGKDTQLLTEAATAFGINARADMWKLHSRFVGPYAVQDAVATLATHVETQKEIARQGLGQVYDLECAILPIILKMRFLGVRVDLEKAHALSKTWKEHEDGLMYDVLLKYNTHLDPWSGPSIASVCDQLKISYPRAPKGGPSFTQPFLDGHGHPFLTAVRQIRRYNSLRTRFVDGLIFDNQVRGRIHTQFHQLRGDEYGVRGGRFSSSNPNLQQVPARDPDLAPLIRGLFIPEDGCEWAKLDYSQQEPRILVHYAYKMKLRGADVARKAWVDNPLMDYYKFTGEVAQLKRKDAKDATLGRFYGMGFRKFASKYGHTEDRATEILDTFDVHNPYVKSLSEKCIEQADRRGYIRTIHGRICHFEFFRPRDAKWEEGVVSIKGREAAEKEWPDRPLVRDHTRKALNRLIQGSAGDMTKLAMLSNYQHDGAIPHLQVHDELDYSSEARARSEGFKSRMESCVPLEVPIIAELENLTHWK